MAHLAIQADKAVGNLTPALEPEPKLTRPELGWRGVSLTSLPLDKIIAGNPFIDKGRFA